MTFNDIRHNRKQILLNGLDLKVLTPLYPRVLSYINMEGGRNVEMFRVKNKFLTREPEILILFYVYLFAPLRQNCHGSYLG